MRIRLVRDVEDGNGGAAKRHDIRLMATRDSAPIGPDLLSPLQPLQIEKSLWPFGRSPTVTLLALHNGSDRSVEFSTPAITGFQRDGGGGVVGSEAATVTPGPASVTRLIPGAATNYTLALPSALSAGKYKLTMLVAGTGGGVSERALEISVRASWLVAFTLFTLGALAGHIVSQWRGRGQRMVDDFIRLARLRDELSRIEQEAAATQTDAPRSGPQATARRDRPARSRRRRRHQRHRRRRRPCRGARALLRAGAAGARDRDLRGRSPARTRRGDRRRLRRAELRSQDSRGGAGGIRRRCARRADARRRHATRPCQDSRIRRARSGGDDGRDPPRARRSQRCAVRAERGKRSGTATET